MRYAPRRYDICYALKMIEAPLFSASIIDAVIAFIFSFFAGFIDAQPECRRYDAIILLMIF